MNRYFTLVYLFSSIISLAIASPPVSSTQCGVNGNTDTICSPKPGEQWTNETWHLITWNPMYPIFASSEHLDIYVYRVENYEHNVITIFQNVTTTKGHQAVLVSDAWFPKTLPTVDTQEVLIYLINSGQKPDSEMNNMYSIFPSPIPITIAEKVTSDLSNTTTSMEHTPSLTQPSSATLQPWVIIVIVIASVAFLAACLLGIWILRYVRRRKQVFDEKGQHTMRTDIHAPHPTLFSAASVTCASIPATLGEAQSLHQSSNTWLMNMNRVNNQSSAKSISGSLPAIHDVTRGTCILRPSSVASFSNLSTRSIGEPPLSSADALLIANTFRQRMRNPEWHRSPSAQVVSPTPVTDLRDQDAARRQASEELLKKELAADGTLMKKISKRPPLPPVDK